jgi:polar amino acid transport system substrate-binding protein
VETFVREGLDAVAGVRQFLDDRARAIPGLRVLSDSFQRVDQAIGVPKGRPAAVAYVYAFIEEMKRSGEVRRDLDATGQRSAGVAPPA